MVPQQTVAGFDVDGVVADAVGYVCGRLGLNPNRWTSWKPEQCYSASEAKAIRRLFGEPGVYVEAKVIWGAGSALGALTKAGVPVVFISGVPAEYAVLRQWWLERYLGDYVKDVVLFTASQSAKHLVALEVGVTHYLDDNAAVAHNMVTVGIDSSLVPSRYRGGVPDGVTDATIEQYVDAVLESHRAAKVVGRAWPVAVQQFHRAAAGR